MTMKIAKHQIRVAYNWEVSEHFGVLGYFWLKIVNEELASF